MGLIHILVVAAVTAAEVPVMPNQYTLMCEGEQATGFNWRQGAWVKANFRPEKYLLTVLPTNKCIGEIKPGLEQLASAEFFTREVCLNSREFGSRYEPFASGKCTEFYVRSNGAWERSFSCDNIFIEVQGRFDGWFHRVSGMGDTKDRPEKDYKDSMLLEIGKCSQIG